MAKKQLVPDTIQKQFNKIQFKINVPVLFTWLGIKNMDMLYKLNKWVGALCIQLNQKAQSILVAFKLKCIRPHIQQDASLQMIQDPLEILNLRDASNPATLAQIQKYLETPAGQIMKAEATITIADEYLNQLANKLQNPMSVSERMLFHLALQECVMILQKNEAILNSIPQSKSNETF